ncbi:MAG: hypothetical protein J6Y20_13050 [Lachnospiraceae bacterium]|nr:hypothetical protein [Lachnospiraceae bacterium]
MASSGSFYNYPVSQFGLYCEWTSAKEASSNSTTITLNVYLRYYTIDVGGRSNCSVNINGVTQSFSTSAINDMSSSSWHNVLLTTKTQKVTHNADGTKTGVTLSASWPFNGTYSGTSIGTITASTTVNLDSITTYTLSTSAGTGSNITVNRTSSGYGSTGNLSNGSRLYYGDNLKITFTPSSNYAINAHTVNGSTFTSGNTHTVKGNVTVAATAQVLASSVGATNANIGSVSTITVTKYNNSYYHSLQYTFGSATGYIKADGTTSSSEVKISQASVAFAVPTSFYAQIPNAKTGTCTITCRTYSSSSSSTVLGSAATCTFTATASESACKPEVSGAVVDINADTISLTGNNRALIKYKSTARCTINAGVPSGTSGTIVSKMIDGVELGSNNYRDYPNITTNNFRLRAEDSRGYVTTGACGTTNWIPYINLTCNPVVSRPNPTGSSLVLALSGDLFRGSFGAYNNSLVVRYRYKEKGGSYGSWTTIGSGITYGTDKYYTPPATPISLGNSFDYQKEYVVQVNAYDGANSIKLTDLTKTINVPTGMPVFDWGKNDFSINVDTFLNGYCEARGDLVVYQSATVGSDLAVGESLIIGGSVVADFVIETGTSNGLTYAKWASGKSECWGSIAFSSLNISTSVSPFYRSSQQTQSLPSGLFTVGPAVTLTPAIDSATCACYCSLYSASTSTIRYYIYSLTSFTNRQLSVNIHAIGRWK